MHFQLDPESVTIVIEDDGTEVENDAFFKKLPAQTVFVFLRKGEKWRGGRNFNFIYVTSPCHAIAVTIKILFWNTCICMCQSTTGRSITHFSSGV